MLLWTTYIYIWVSKSRVFSQRVFLEGVDLVFRSIHKPQVTYLLLFPFLINDEDLSSDGTLLDKLISFYFPRLRLN